jgi:hypothetical protein
LRATDPLSGQFAADELLSGASTIVYGTFSPSFSLVADVPQEGASRYSVAALSPLYGPGDFAAAPLAPPTISSTTATFAVPGVEIPSSAASGNIAATVNIGTAGKYDKGALVVTRDGAIVNVASLDDALTQSQSSTVVTVEDVPASATSGFERGLYYLDAWVWNSADPENTFSHQAGAAAIDLRTTLTGTAAVTIN